MVVEATQDEYCADHMTARQSKCGKQAYGEHCIGSAMAQDPFEKDGSFEIHGRRLAWLN